MGMNLDPYGTSNLPYELVSLPLTDKVRKEIVIWLVFTNRFQGSLYQPLEVADVSTYCFLIIFAKFYYSELKILKNITLSVKIQMSGRTPILTCSRKNEFLPI